MYVGVEPVKVAKVKPGEFCIQFSDQLAAKKMMELDGVCSAEDERPCRIKEVDQVFLVDQMFHLLAWKLEGRDKVDQFCRPAVTAYERYRSPTRDPRYVRIADQDAKEGVARRGGDEGRSPPRSPLPPSSSPGPALGRTRSNSPKPSRVSSPETPRPTGSSGRSSPVTPSRQWRGGGIKGPKVPRILGMQIREIGTIPRVVGAHILGRMAREKKVRERERGRKEREWVSFLTNAKAGIKAEGGIRNHWCSGFGIIGRGIGSQ